MLSATAVDDPKNPAVEVYNRPVKIILRKVSIEQSRWFSVKFRVSIPNFFGRLKGVKTNLKFHSVSNHCVVLFVTFSDDLHCFVRKFPASRAVY